MSWYEAQPAQSLLEIRASGANFTDPIIDVGGGASLLVDELLSAGYRDVTVLDISADVLRMVAKRLAGAGTSVHFIQSDVTSFKPTRHYALWHDRAMFHFLVQAEDRKRHLDVLRQALAPAGQVVLATFGPKGPERCSGLPVARYGADTLSAELGPDFRLAVARKAEVTVFTTSPGKITDARRMGAREAVLWSDAAAMKRLASYFDLMIATVPRAFPMQAFMDLLKLDATLANVGALDQLQGLNGMALGFGRKSLAGSMIGGVAETQEVIDYCAARNIKADIELIRVEDINGAYERVVNKDVRYRFVIDMASLKASA